MISQRTSQKDREGMAPLIIISGPAGVGKSTVIQKLKQVTNRPIHISVSATTRQPREGEIDGVHYHFWTEEKFEEERAKGSFLEHAIVHGTHYYGTPRSEVDLPRSQGKAVILDIDVQGAEQVRRKYPEAFSIFLTAPDYETRLRERHSEDEEGIQRRLKSAKLELARANEYNTQLTNQTIDETVRQLNQLLEEQFVKLNKG
jgi:guanylate kinase